MTVAELIQALQKVDPDLPVSVEGCDCEGKAIGVSVIEGEVIVRRRDGVFQGDRHEVVR